MPLVHRAVLRARAYSFAPREAATSSDTKAGAHRVSKRARRATR